MYTLLIIFKDGHREVIHNVDEFGCPSGNHYVFHFVKKGLRSFVPLDAVVYFGHYEHLFQGDEL